MLLSGSSWFGFILVSISLVSLELLRNLRRFGTSQLPFRGPSWPNVSIDVYVRASHFVVRCQTVSMAFLQSLHFACSAVISFLFLEWYPKLENEVINCVILATRGLGCDRIFRLFILSGLGSQSFVCLQSVLLFHSSVHLS